MYLSLITFMHNRSILFRTLKVNYVYHISLGREQKNILHNLQGRDITRVQREEFPKWFKNRVRYTKENN